MPTTKTSKQNPAQARKEARESDYAPLYAVAGLTDVLAETLKANIIESQDRATRRMVEAQAKRTEQARANAEELRRLIASVPVTLKALPETTRARLNELQQQANGIVAQVNSTYTELAGRGKRAVDDVWTRTEQRADEARSEMVERVDPAFEQVQETVTVARQTVTGKTSTETVTPRTAARSAVIRAAATAAASERQAAESEAERKEAARKAAVRKAAARKAAATRAAKKALAETAVLVEADTQAEAATPVVKQGPVAKQAPAATPTDD